MYSFDKSLLIHMHHIFSVVWLAIWLCLRGGRFSGPKGRASGKFENLEKFFEFFRTFFFGRYLGNELRILRMFSSDFEKLSMRKKLVKVVPNLFFEKVLGWLWPNFFLKNISNFKVLASASDSARSEKHFKRIFGPYLKIFDRDMGGQSF